MIGRLLNSEPKAIKDVPSETVLIQPWRSEPMMSTSQNSSDASNRCHGKTVDHSVHIDVLALTTHGLPSSKCPINPPSNPKSTKKWSPVKRTLQLHPPSANLWGRYIASDPVLVEARLKAKRLCRKLTDSVGDPDDLGPCALAAFRGDLLDSLFASCNPGAIEVEPPFWCDYGFNISVGMGFYCNYHCTILGILPPAIVLWWANG
jgi:hypothetical protein